MYRMAVGVEDKEIPVILAGIVLEAVFRKNW